MAAFRPASVQIRERFECQLWLSILGVVAARGATSGTVRDRETGRAFAFMPLGGGLAPAAAAERAAANPLKKRSSSSVARLTISSTWCSSGFMSVGLSVLRTTTLGWLLS